MFRAKQFVDGKRVVTLHGHSGVDFWKAPKDSADGQPPIETSIRVWINVAPGLSADLLVMLSSLLIDTLCNSCY